MNLNIKLGQISNRLGFWVELVHNLIFKTHLTPQRSPFTAYHLGHESYVDLETIPHTHYALTWIHDIDTLWTSGSCFGKEKRYIYSTIHVYVILKCLGNVFIY